MDNWTLKRKIDNYENMIDDRRQDIQNYNRRIISLTSEKVKLVSMQSDTESFYTSKRQKCTTLLSSVRGRASQGSLNKCLELYSVANGNYISGRLLDMKQYVNLNIHKLKEMIEEAENDILRYQSSIQSCNREIADIERREREDAEFNSK